MLVPSCGLGSESWLCSLLAMMTWAAETSHSSYIKMGAKPRTPRAPGDTNEILEGCAQYHASPWDPALELLAQLTGVL